MVASTKEGPAMRAIQIASLDGPQAAKLVEIFPGHSISAADIAGDLSIGRRQMVEVARATRVRSSRGWLEGAAA